MFQCTKCSAQFFSRDDLRQHQFGHLYPDAKSTDDFNDLKQISEKDEIEFSSMEKVIEGEDIFSSETKNSGPSAPKSVRWFIAKNIKRHKCTVVSTNQLDPQKMPAGWKVTGSSHSTQAGARKQFVGLCGNNNNC